MLPALQADSPLEVFLPVPPPVQPAAQALLLSVKPVEAFRGFRLQMAQIDYYEST